MGIPAKTYESAPAFCAGPDDQVSLAHRLPCRRSSTPDVDVQEATKGLKTARYFIMTRPKQRNHLRIRDSNQQ